MTMCNSGCGDNSIKFPVTGDVRDAIQIVGGKNINVTKERLSDIDKYTIAYQEYISPTITYTPQTIVQTGVVVPSITFTGNIQQGSEEIVTRTMIPDKSLNLSSPFSWKEINISGTAPGLFPKYSGQPTTITVLDADGKTTTKQVGVEVRNAFFCGFNTSDTLTESQIITLTYNHDLLNSILDKYSSFTYTYKTMPTYLYWVYPVGSKGITYASEGVMSVPTVKLSDAVTVTEYGVPTLYEVVRTANKTVFDNSIIKLS